MFNQVKRLAAECNGKCKYALKTSSDDATVYAESVDASEIDHASDLHSEMADDIPATVQTDKVTGKPARDANKYQVPKLPRKDKKPPENNASFVDNRPHDLNESATETDLNVSKDSYRPEIFYPVKVNPDDENSVKISEGDIGEIN